MPSVLKSPSFPKKIKKGGITFAKVRSEWRTGTENILRRYNALPLFLKNRDRLFWFLKGSLQGVPMAQNTTSSHQSVVRALTHGYLVRAARGSHRCCFPSNETVFVPD